MASRSPSSSPPAVSGGGDGLRSITGECDPAGDGDLSPSTSSAPSTLRSGNGKTFGARFNESPSMAIGHKHCFQVVSWFEAEVKISDKMQVTGQVVLVFDRMETQHSAIKSYTTNRLTCRKTSSTLYFMAGVFNITGSTFWSRSTVFIYLHQIVFEHLASKLMGRVFVIRPFKAIKSTGHATLTCELTHHDFVSTYDI